MNKAGSAQGHRLSNTYFTAGSRFLPTEDCTDLEGVIRKSLANVVQFSTRLDVSKGGRDGVFGLKVGTRIMERDITSITCFGQFLEQSLVRANNSPMVNLTGPGKQDT